MLRMQKYRRLRSRRVFAMLLALALTSSCARRVALNSSSDGAGQSDSRDLPFHGDQDTVGATGAVSHPRVPDQRDASSKALPFNTSASALLPAGTLLTVRLESALTSASPDVGKTFRALVEEPVTIDGRTIIPRDAEVKGRVESSRVSIAKRRTGYLRLTLDSIRLGNKDIPLPTSSLFARGIIDTTRDDSPTSASPARPIAHSSEIIRLKKGRPLTFRLTAPVDLSKPADDKPQSGTK
jgi:hypothetical protein